MLITLCKPTIHYLRYSQSLRCLSTSGRLSEAFETIDINFGIVHKKSSKRSENVKIENFNNTSRIKHLDRRFNILNGSHRRILDLGYVPGNWITYIRNRMAKIHNIDPDKVNKKCHILGFDFMFGAPPAGVSAIQGNIFSKSAQSLIIDYFKEAAWMELKHKLILQEDEVNPRSYFSKEQDEEVFINEIREIELGLNHYSTSPEKINELTKKRDLLLPDYRIDLVFQDLGKPGYQNFGFYSNSVSMPYIKYSHYESLNFAFENPNKANFDFLDASLILNCKLLKPGGKFVVRMNEVDPNDKEFELVREKLLKIFNSVLEVNNYATDNDKSLVQSFEKYFICDSKKDDHEYDPYELFAWQAPPEPVPVPIPEAETTNENNEQQQQQQQ